MPLLGIAFLPNCACNCFVGGMARSAMMRKPKFFQLTFNMNRWHVLFKHIRGNKFQCSTWMHITLTNKFCLLIYYINMKKLIFRYIFLSPKQKNHGDNDDHWALVLELIKFYIIAIKNHSIRFFRVIELGTYFLQLQHYLHFIQQLISFI